MTDRSFRGRFTAIDTLPLESPGEVRITFNVPAKVYQECGRFMLDGEAIIQFIPSAVPSHRDEEGE